jgi:hypothetical protein
LSVPKRPHYFLQREPAAVNAVLHLFLRIVEATLRAYSPDAGLRGRLGAVSFLHRFGSALNPHVHFHCWVLDGVFDVEPESCGQVRFREAVGLSAQEVAAVQAQVRRRVLRGFVRRGWLSEEDWSTGQLVEYSLLNQSPTQPITYSTNHLLNQSTTCPNQAPMGART